MTPMGSFLNASGALPTEYEDCVLPKVERQSDADAIRQKNKAIGEDFQAWNGLSQEEDGGTGMVELHERYSSRNAKFTEVVTRMTSLRMSKWNDYGGSFAELFQSYEWAYIVPRLVEKVKRLESLTLAGNEQQVSDEKLEDTLMDIAVICLNAITEMEMEGEEVVSDDDTDGS